MGPSELLRRVAEVLESLDIRYLVTGSMATIAYGEPRFTNDVDILHWASRLGLSAEWDAVLAREGNE